MKNLFPALLLSSLLVTPLSAKPLANEAGWEFTISLNAGYVSGQSNLSTSDDNEIISDVDSKAESTDSVIAFPFARIQYTTEDLNTQFFLGNSRDQISTSQFQYELGVTHQFADKSKITAAYFPELPLFNDTWEDPFLVDQARTKTDDNAQGGRIQLDRIAGSPITLKYAYARNKVDNDNSGESWSGLTTQQLQSLQRSSQYHRAEIETMFPVYLQQTKVFLKPTLQYTARIADGDAISYDEYNFQLGLLIFSGRHTSITTFNIGNSSYKDKNPIFDNKQDSINLGIFSVYSYAEAFNWKPVTFTLIAGYSQKDSDITFYDENGLIVSAGLAYTF
ncbi:hypothetical protein GCM10007916_36800 [Psychromonas marina]|uniref:DUF2860 domain-containing protein n=1 Tax=Psychromonas marina TaxID=88364 RepID=A0ABQ6E5X9_9GAMM|nr:DUF2860 domain-containing protein [Psychromonas marina]GLS92608.1 hypothetical protein GCM10007916_36800 [Psychromonas marina]